jgi:hypothetical protein
MKSASLPLELGPVAKIGCPFVLVLVVVLVLDVLGFCGEKKSAPIDRYFGQQCELETPSR